MSNGANVHTFSDKWMFNNCRVRYKRAYVISVGCQKLLILGKGDINNLKDASARNSKAFDILYNFSKD